MFSEIYDKYSIVYKTEIPGIQSSNLKGWGIHVINGNGDPNNPKAYVNGFDIIEHLDGTTVESRPLSHEIISYATQGRHIEGDSQNYTFFTDLQKKS